jgi:hypothetical protein
MARIYQTDSESDEYWVCWNSHKQALGRILEQFSSEWQNFDSTKTMGVYTLETHTSSHEFSVALVRGKNITIDDTICTDLSGRSIYTCIMIFLSLQKIIDRPTEHEISNKIIWCDYDAGAHKWRTKEDINAFYDTVVLPIIKILYDQGKTFIYK